METLETLIGKFCKILFYDGFADPKNVRSIKGDLISFDDDFIKIKTLQNELILSKNSVIKIFPIIREENNHEF